MLCLFPVSAWFVQHASLTVNIDRSDITNRYYTVLYHTVVVYEKKNRSLVFSGSRKIPTLGSIVQWETRQVSFPTGTVGPRVGIFLSPLNTNDGFYLPCVQEQPLSCQYLFSRKCCLLITSAAHIQLILSMKQALWTLTWLIIPCQYFWKIGISRQESRQPKSCIVGKVLNSN